MASAYEMPNLRFAGEAGAVVARRRFVKFNSAGKVVQAVAGDSIVGGSATEATATGEVVDIYDGIVIIEAGAAVTAGTLVQSDANGKAVTLTANTVASTGNAETLTIPVSKRSGYAITGAAADGEFIAVKI